MPITTVSPMLLGDVAQAAGLGGAAGRVGLRVEEHQHLATGEVGQADGLAVLVGQGEVGGG